jgi:hypothetical protein
MYFYTDSSPSSSQDKSTQGFGFTFLVKEKPQA